MLFDVVFCSDGKIIRLRISSDQARVDNILAPVYYNMLTMDIGDHIIINNRTYYIVRVG